MIYVGIDVSKATFVVAYSPEKNSRTRTFKNTTKGIHEFIQTLSPEAHHRVMEATGNYSPKGYLRMRKGNQRTWFPLGHGQ